jgi:formate hydrogenlyase subunit 6/NADH:ubiquinone oxidoreductase subunit I
MAQENVYEKLAMLIGAPPSGRIQGLWKMLCSEEEAALALAMPGTVEELAGKTGLPPGRAKTLAEGLFRKGVAFERMKEGGLKYNRAKDLLQFHDATILWPEAPPEFLLLWQEFMETEYVELTKMIAEMDLAPVTRVIPVEQVLEGGGSRVQPFDSAMKIVEQASRVAVTNCTCRLTARKCESPLEACIQLGRAADYAIKRGTGREVTREEAREILRRSEEAGLVHVTDNRADGGHIVCNCCSCCCIVLPVILRTRKRVLLAPSRFLPEVNLETCNLCGVCVEACPVQAMSLAGEKGAERVTVKEDLCIGCGQCAYRCPLEVIALKEVRNPDFIPGAAA